MRESIPDRNGSSCSPLVSLDNLCERIILTLDPRARSDEPFTYIDISSVDNKRKEIVQPKRLLGRHASSRARQVILKGDVLIATTRPNLNAVALVPADFHEQIASTGFCVLRSRGELDPEYLFGFVRSHDFVRNLSALVKGALYPAVTDEQVRMQKIPLPPLPEQRRIAARLRERLSTLTQARSALETQVDDLMSLIRAYISADANEPCAKVRQVCDVLVEITEGVGEAWKNQPVLGATRAGLALAKEPVGKKPERYKAVTAGTIFYNPMRILLGSIAMLSEDDVSGITSPDYVVMRARDGLLHPVWFYHWFRSPAGAEFIKSLTRGAVRERLLFNRLARGEIKVPPYHRQLITVAAIREAENIRRTVEAKLNDLEKLPTALLREAFNGNSN